MTDQWWLARKDFPDSRTGFVVPLTFGRARITIGTGELWFDDGW